jgi:D-alanyl-D-alanine carboxypeptidase/D-alanyl-D-alanine-endopeptidase (penicillin-binding protein 4)
MFVRKFLAAAIAGLTLLVVFASPSIGAPDSETGAVTQASVTPTTPVLSARRFPGVLQATTADPALSAAIDQFLSKVVGSTCVIVEVDGRTVYERRTSEAFVPASTMKLATAMAALDILGADAKFTTRFVASDPPTNGVIEGDLFIVGGGDPLLATSGYKTVFDDPDQFYEDFTTVADSLNAAGIRSIRGDLVGDDSRYDAVRWVPTWPARYQVGGTVAPLSALLVNDGNTGYTDTPNDATSNRKAGDSPLLFAQTLRTVLNSRGITVEGVATTGRAPSDGEEVASFDSVPMSQVLTEMLKNSDNTTAELVLKEIGLQSRGQGTTAAGIEATKESLKNQSFDVTDLVMLDGSGLDTGNRMSCELSLALVSAVSQRPEFSDALPLGGKSGTLRKRMLATPSTGRVRAKTGTLNSVNALAGFADTPQGSTLSFAFMHNGTDPRTTGVADGFTDRLMAFPKGPKIALLEPLPVK